MIYATISGPAASKPGLHRSHQPDGRGTPFVTGILNATGLAFNPEGDLFVTSAPKATSTASTLRRVHRVR